MLSINSESCLWINKNIYIIFIIYCIEGTICYLGRQMLSENLLLTQICLNSDIDHQFYKIC